MSKPSSGFLEKFWSVLSSALSSSTSHFTSEYESHSQLAAMASLPLLEGWTYDSQKLSKHQSFEKPAEEILHELQCAAHCLANSFCTAVRGHPMGNSFVQEVL
jgi:hypothetical protein